MFKIAKASLLSVSVLAAAGFGLSGLNLYTFNRFTAEVVVGSLFFEQLDDEQFAVEWRPVSGKDRDFVLRGEEWQLDVRMIKWTDWLTFLGEDPLYQLDRISGRYRDASKARMTLPDVIDLSDQDLIDLWPWMREKGSWLPGVDATYGSSVFLPMVDGARYRVWMTRVGLIARPIKDA